MPNRPTIQTDLERRFRLLVLAFADCATSPPPRGTCLHPWPAVILQQETLEAQGDPIATDEVVLWMPRGAVAKADQRACRSRVSDGVRIAKEYVGRPEWKFRGDPRIYFNVADSQFICNAPPGNTVYIPLWRMREDQAPWM